VSLNVSRFDLVSFRYVLIVCIINLSDFGFMFYRDDNISLFVTFFNVAVRLGHLFQWIASIYDRFELSYVDQFFEHKQVFELVAAIGVGVDLDIDPRWFERFLPCAGVRLPTASKTTS
jgi:hypothetical protein